MSLKFSDWPLKKLFTLMNHFSYVFLQILVVTNFTFYDLNNFSLPFICQIISIFAQFRLQTMLVKMYCLLQFLFFFFSSGIVIGPVYLKVNHRILIWRSKEIVIVQVHLKKVDKAIQEFSEKPSKKSQSKPSNNCICSWHNCFHVER